MPANLTPQYLKAEEAYKAATTPEEQLEGLEEMLRLLPKHKGTEKIQADLRRRIAALRKGGGGGKAKGTRLDPFHVLRTGGGQVVLLGAPNTGKSTLLGALTRAKVEISAAPGSTQGPVPGIMHFEDAPIQLVDLPPILADFVPPGMMGCVRNTDAVLVCCDLSAPEVLEQAELALARCEEAKVRLHPPGQPPQTEEELAPGWKQLPALVLCTKLDLPGSAETLAVFRELWEGRLPLHAVSGVKGAGLEELRRLLFDLLGLLRVYSKEPGKPPSKDAPFLLKRGETALDLARRIHKDLVGSFKFARVWGSVRHDGIQVSRDYVLQDGDVVEVHA